MRTSGAAGALSALKREVATIEGTQASLEDGPSAQPFGIDGIDAALNGGLIRGALHEFGPAGAIHLGATFGFALALGSRALAAHRRHVFWIETTFAAAETGRPYGIGLDDFGLPARHLLIVRVPRPIDVLWVMEEALSCRAIAAVIGALTDDVGLNVTRRLSLAARASGGLGLMVRHRSSPMPSAAVTRWQIAAAPSRLDADGGVGHAAFDLSLVKNRHGRCGRWTILWDPHERAFRDPALSVGVAQAAFDRSDRPFLRAG